MTLPYLVPVFSAGSIILDGKTFPIDSLGHLRVCKSLLVVASASAGGPERSGVRVSGQDSLQRGRRCAPYSGTVSFLRDLRRWHRRVLQGAACVREHEGRCEGVRLLPSLSRIKPALLDESGLKGCNSMGTQYKGNDVVHVFKNESSIGLYLITLLYGKSPVPAGL